jgi:glycosyltransferase involved in cell wall biosynthesis
MKKAIKKLSIVIPVWNEEPTLERLLAKVEKVDLKKVEKEIILIDDGSKDKTWEILQKYRSKSIYKIYKNTKNIGKTQTVKRGILKSTGDVVIIQDADLEYDPEDYKVMLQEFANNATEVVYGNRFGTKLKEGGPNYYGNLALTFFSNLFTRWRGFKVNDMETCYKMVKGDIIRDIAKDIETKSKFGLEPELTARLSKYKVEGRHLKLKSVDINYYPRSAAEDKKLKAFRDGTKALIEIVKYNLSQ